MSFFDPILKTAHLVESAAKAVSQMFEHSDLEKVSTAFSRGLINSASDKISRVYFAATGQLDLDILQDGAQIDGMAGLAVGDILLSRAASMRRAS